MSISSANLTPELRAYAAELGFTLVGVTPALGPQGLAGLKDWLARGYAGEMRYIANRLEAYADPNLILDGVRSFVMLGLPYQTELPALAQAGQGRIARYAWGEADYHDLIHERLALLAAKLELLAPEAKIRGVVDTAPLLEREFAQLAGLGWVGKNTLLLNRVAGSYFFLAALLTDQVLDYDQPFSADHCGSCTACLEACPTDAFPQPYVLDASRCISYLTIELKGAIPTDLREGMGNWLFGCDICQEVCPWNRKAPISGDSGFQPRDGANPVELAPLFSLDEAGFKQLFRHTPLWRAKRRGILRNAAIVLGNSGDASALNPLHQGLTDIEPLVRGAAAWALGQIAMKTSLAAITMLLTLRITQENDPLVQLEIQQSLTRILP